MSANFAWLSHEGENFPAVQAVDENALVGLAYLVGGMVIIVFLYPGLRGARGEDDVLADHARPHAETGEHPLERSSKPVWLLTMQRTGPPGIFAQKIPLKSSPLALKAV